MGFNYHPSDVKLRPITSKPKTDNQTKTGNRIDYM